MKFRHRVTVPTAGARTHHVPAGDRTLCGIPITDRWLLLTRRQAKRRGYLACRRCQGRTS